MQSHFSCKSTGGLKYVLRHLQWQTLLAFCIVSVVVILNIFFIHWSSRLVQYIVRDTETTWKMWYHFWGQQRNKSYSEVSDGTVESKELIEDSVWTTLCSSVVPRTEQVLLLVGPCLECLIITDIWGKEEAWDLAFHKLHNYSKCSYCALSALLGEEGMQRDCDGQFLHLHSVIDYFSPRSKFILNFTLSFPCVSSSSSVVKLL